MTKFNFKAVKIDGEKIEGVRESADKFSLYNELKEEGSTLVTASQVSNKQSWFKGFSLFNSVSEQQKIIFSKNLGSMIDAGLPIAKGLAILEKQTKNKKFKSIIVALESDIARGLTLSESAAAYPNVFSNIFVFMVKAGEESGKLSEALSIVGNQMDNTYKLKKKIKGAMIYPSIVLSVMLIVGALMLIYVVPGITATFKDLHVELPLTTRILIGASDFLKNNILLSLAFLVILFFVGYAGYHSKSGKRAFEFIILRLPIIGDLVKETNSARITRTISSLLSSGVPFAEAILITKDVLQNSYYKEILDEARIKVEKGETISSVFLQKTNLCPIFVGEMMNVGEETGRLPSMLMEVANFYENSVDQKTKDMSTIIEPVLMIFIGLAVGFFALAVLKPIYSVMDNVS